MLYIAGAILIAAAIISWGIFFLSFTLARGFTRMSDALTSATAALDAAVAKVVTDVSAGLTDIANSISDHIANGTATSAILAEVDKLNALDTSVLAAEQPAPAPGPETTPAPEPVDTLAGGNADDSVSAG